MQSGLRQSFVPRFASAVPFASLGNASCHIFNLSFSILKKTFLPGLLQKASNRNIVGRISQQPINTGYTECKGENSCNVVKEENAITGGRAPAPKGSKMQVIRSGLRSGKNK